MDLLMRHKLAALLGFLFGAVSPMVGVYIGLQVSTPLGTILAWPLVAMSAVTGEPFGAFSGLKLGVALFLSGLLWSPIFAAIARARSR